MQMEFGVEKVDLEELCKESDYISLCAPLLKSTKGTIAGAGLDVFENEPLEKNSELYNLDNVVLSDHTGWYSENSLSELKRKAAQNIADTLTEGKPTYIVE